MTVGEKMTENQQPLKTPKQPFLPPEDLSVPILIPFALYNAPMLDCESMKVSAIVTNNMEPDQAYLAKYNVVMVDPPISVTVSISVRNINKNIYFVNSCKARHSGPGSNSKSLLVGAQVNH